MATTNEHGAEQRTVDDEWVGLRTSVLKAAKAMYREGLVAGTSGNVSARCGRELLAITATGVEYDAMALDDIVVVDFDGEPVIGDAIPSTEMLMHAAIYRAREDAGAVMHTHSVYATALAVAGMPIPALVDEMVVYVGGAIEVSDYTFPGTEELGDRVIEALGERNAALIRNHGLVGVGKDPADALRTCVMAERLAHVFTIANALGNAEPLPPAAVETELELFRMRRSAEEGA